MKVFSQEYTDLMPEGMFGGKAQNLALMSAAGVRVPPGFAMSPSEVVGRKDIAHLIRAVCGGYPVAVRSSAIGEDGAGQSFAGQYDTVLNLFTLPQTMKAIQQVRKSADNTRIEAYREEFGLDSGGVGVVIQQMLRPTSSGVMFTAEPVEGDTSLVAIESVPGLGDKLVSGQASPDFVLLQKATGVTVEETSIDEPVLGRTERNLLLEAGLGLEALFGCPQDIEWAFSNNGTLFILQSRPITTL